MSIKVASSQNHTCIWGKFTLLEIKQISQAFVT